MSPSPLTDELKGKGSLYEDDTLIRDVSYQIDVFQRCQDAVTEV